MIKPDYYHQGNIDVIKFGEENFSEEELKGFYRMNVLKYVTRFDKKNGLQDLEKAKFYLDKLVDMSEAKEEIKPYKPKINDPYDYFMRSLAKLPVNPSRKTSWTEYFVPNSKVSTFYGGTNEND